MSIEGFVDYQRREFCKDVKCPVQLDLDAQKPDSEGYERIRMVCTMSALRSWMLR